MENVHHRDFSLSRARHYRFGGFIITNVVNSFIMDVVYPVFDLNRYNSAQQSPCLRQLQAFPCRDGALSEPAQLLQ